MKQFIIRKIIDELLSKVNFKKLSIKSNPFLPLFSGEIGTQLFGPLIQLQEFDDRRNYNAQLYFPYFLNNKMNVQNNTYLFHSNKK